MVEAHIVPEQTTAANRKASRDWTPALRGLYDAVVDEPLPPAMADLLAALERDYKNREPVFVDKSREIIESKRREK